MISYDGSTEDECVIWVQGFDGERGRYEYVAWVPDKKAIVGKWLRFDDMQGNWQVAERWGTRFSDVAQARSHDHTQQRKASDV